MGFVVTLSDTAAIQASDTLPVSVSTYLIGLIKNRFLAMLEIAIL
jgi:hypothetical protein